MAKVGFGVVSGHGSPLLFRGGAARLGPATPGLVAAGWWLLAQRKAASPPQTPPLKRRGLQRPPPVGSCPSIPRADRKSVGSGKSVSVRVDHGGPRVIKKKIN